MRKRYKIPSRMREFLARLGGLLLAPGFSRGVKGKLFVSSHSSAL